MLKAKSRKLQKRKKSDSMNIIRNILTKNECYIQNKKIKPIGIVVHSTGCNNKNIDRYTKSWNKTDVGKCVHGFVGLWKGKVEFVQTLPFTTRCWGCGKGAKGSYNNSHIQFEICEDGLKDKTYFTQVYNKAVDACAYLCKLYNIPVENIVCHCEAHKLGYASNHADVMHWFPKYGKSMDTFRADVKVKLYAKVEKAKRYVTVNTKSSNLLCRKSPSSESTIVGKFAKGTKLELLLTTTGWSKVSGKDIKGKTITGYCSSDYLK